MPKSLADRYGIFFRESDDADQAFAALTIAIATIDVWNRLYGSLARGDARPGSDVDLAVSLRSSGSLLDESRASAGFDQPTTYAGPKTIGEPQVTA